MGKKQKLLYNTALVISNVVLMVSLIAVVFSHLRIGELESTAGQVGRAFSGEMQNEYEMMKNIRIIGVAVLLTSLGLTTVLGDKYYKLHSEPKRKVKKGFVGGLYFVIFGIVAYTYLAYDLLNEAIGLALLLVGVYSILIHSAYLLILDGRSQGTGAGTSETASYCSDCGNSISKSDSYCPNCGSKV